MGSDYFGAAGDAMIEEMKAENIEEYLRWVWCSGVCGWRGMIG